MRKLTKKRATGLARTLVLASATLAILLVCFSIYQYTQSSPIDTRTSRLPSIPTDSERLASPAKSSDAPGTSLGSVGGVVGPGKKVSLTIYGENGQDARMELTVSSWTPVRDAPHEFLLNDPEIRMRTDDGHAVRVTARRGWMEARRKGPGGIDPKRGRLSGGVQIQYDRLTFEQREALPESQRNTIDPADILQIEMQEIEFDVEYAKVVIPGELRITASDFSMVAADLELRFNEVENRVETLRIDSGGTLTLKTAGNFDLNVGGDRQGKAKLTLIDWFRDTMQEALAAQQSRMAQSASASQTNTPQSQTDQERAERESLASTDESIPVFQPDRAGTVRPKAPLRYLARFEGDVDARQSSGGEVLARLNADALEILRDVRDQSQFQSQETQTPPSQDKQTPGELGYNEPQITVTWTQRLVIEACSTADERCAADIPSQVTALGTPAHLTYGDGSAKGTRLVFEPDSGNFSIYGIPDLPAAVFSEDQGTIQGIEIHSSQDGDEFHIIVKGPGALRRASNAMHSDANTQLRSGSTITFLDQLDAVGQFVQETRLTRGGRISRQRRMMISRADFSGAVNLTDGDDRFMADALTVYFKTHRSLLGQYENSIDRIVGLGHVNLTQSDDHITCRELDIEMTKGLDGRIVPRLATARGNVSAKQSDRTIEAREELVIDFTTYEAPRRPFDAAKAYKQAKQAGADVTQIDWDARRREHEAVRETRVGVSRLRAKGDVRVLDTSQHMEVTAESLDAVVNKSQALQTARVVGTEQTPASVVLEAFTVAGEVINLHALDQWAEVPGAGRLTFRSNKDLDGRRLRQPIPVVVTWTNWMRFRGRENKSVFSGQVHAASETTTFDCDQLVIEFEDVQQGGETSKVLDWWILEDLMHGIRTSSGTNMGGTGFAKEPTYLLASGRATVLTSEFDEKTGRLESRARISGPRLSINLRSDVSKMMIEGAGNLLLEDYRAGPSEEDINPTNQPKGQGLFHVGPSSGPSTTLIEWKDFMWYDFGVYHARFAGDVSLKHFSGAELARIRGTGLVSSSQPEPGRATFLNCNALTLEFLREREARQEGNERRMGGMSSERIAQFQAEGSVVLQDESEGLSLTADRVVYWKDRNGLAVYGTPQQRAHLVVQKPGQLPQQVAVERLFYNFATGKAELFRVDFKNR